MCVLPINLFHIFGPLAVPSDLCAVNARLDLANSVNSKPCISWHISPSAFNLQKVTPLSPTFPMISHMRHFLQKLRKITELPTTRQEYDNPIFYYPGQKNRYSREIHEVDLQIDHVISCDIELRFDIDATRGTCASRARVAYRSRCRTISHDRTADQSHEYLGCNDFLARVVCKGCKAVPIRGETLVHSFCSFWVDPPLHTPHA